MTDQIGFISIDLSHTQENVPIIPNKHHKSTSFSTSMWEAARLGDIAGLDYYIQNTLHENSHNNDEEDEEEEEEDKGMAQIVNSRDPDTCCTLLHLAISHNKDPIKILQFLLERGADATISSIYGLQAIHLVLLCCPEPLECIKLLLEYDHHINACDNDGWTPLHYAARFCKDPGPVFQVLINKGADINSVNASNKTWLFALLASGDHSHAMKHLLDEKNLCIKGDFLNTKTRQTRSGSVLLQATKYGRVGCLQMLMDYILNAGILNEVTDRQELLFGIDVAKMELKTSSLGARKRFEQIIDILQDALQQFDINKALSISDEEKQARPTQPYTRFSFLQRLIWSTST